MLVRTKTMILAAATAMTLVLSSCSYKAIDQENKPLPDNETSIVTVDDSLFGKYDPPITVSFVRETTDELERSITRLPGETMEDNRWTRLYEEELGIKIKYDWIVKGTELYQQKLNVAVSSGEIPDIIKVDAYQLKKLSDAGLIRDLTDIYDKYAAPFTKAVLSEEGSGPFDAATINGRLMGIPETESSIERATFLWIRTDWLDRLGLSPPKSIDDVLAISKAFTEQDPDGNGIDDTYGLAVTKNLWEYAMGLDGFMAGFRAYPNLWVEDDEGKIVFGGVQPEVKDALKALQDMFKAGQLDEDFAIKNGVVVAQQVAKGKIGMLYGEQWNSFFPIGASRIHPGVQWQAFPIVAQSEYDVKVPLRFSTNKFLAVRRGFEHPEAVVKLFNLHLEKNWGETSDYDTYYSPHAVWQLSPVTPYPLKKNLNAFRQIEYARKSGDTSALKDEARDIYRRIETFFLGSDLGNWGWERIYGPEGAFAVMDQYDRRGQFLYDKFVGTLTDTMAERKAMLDKLRDDAYIDIILGKPVEEFDAFVRQWRELGGDQITAEVNGGG